MKRIIAILGIVALGLAGFAGACNLLNFSLTQVGANDIYGAQLQNNTGGNFLGHKFQVAFVDASGNTVETDHKVSGCLRSWQNGASDFFSVRSTATSATTVNAIGALDLTQPLIAGTTVSSSAALSSVTASTGTLPGTNPTSATTTMVVKGSLKNNDSVTYQQADVCVVLYNSSDKVVLTQKSSLGDIAVNATNNFTVNVTVPKSSVSVDHVVVWADGLENNVPTHPISSNAALNVGAAKLAFTTQPPTTTTGGAPFPVVVALEDSGGATITTGAGSTANVTLTLSGGTTGATLTCDQASNTMAGVAGVAAFTNCKIDKVGTGYVITASSSGATSVASTAVAITLGPAAKVTFTTQPPATGTQSLAPFGAVAAITDAGGNTVASTDMVQLTVSTGPGTLGGCTASVAASANVATFSGCTLDKAGSYVLRARDVTTTLNDGFSNAIAITAGPATQLVFTTAPSTPTAHGTAFATQPVVAVEDAQGNIVTTDNATTVTLAYSGTGTLTCTAAANTITVAAGVATFAGCKVDTAGSGNISASSNPVRTPPAPVAVTIS